MLRNLLIATLFLCFSAGAQPVQHWVVGPSLASIRSQVQTQEVLNAFGLNITARWMHASLSNNVRFVDWLDETNHYHWYQDNTNNAPTNETSGVHFVASHFLRGTNGLLLSQWSYMYIFNFDADTSATTQTITGDTGDSLSSFRMLFLNPVWKLQLGSDRIMYPPALTAGFHNFIYSEEGGGFACWLDGAPMTDSSGVTGPAINNPYVIGGYMGYLKEAIYFLSNNFDAVTVSNLNWYATNYYSP